MAIKNSLSNDFLSKIFDSINVFDCCLSCVHTVSIKQIGTLYFGVDLFSVLSSFTIILQEIGCCFVFFLS